jgi:poly(3-hydroxybutyrate) depolymerase
MHEMAHFALAPARAVSDVARTWLERSINPLSLTAAGRNLAASAKIFERLTRRYGKPAFDLATTVVDGKIVPIGEWFRRHCICTVPYGCAGVGRDVYPGFLQLTAFWR